MRKILTLIACLSLAACQASLITHGPENMDAEPEGPLQVQLILPDSPATKGAEADTDESAVQSPFRPLRRLKIRVQACRIESLAVDCARNDAYPGLLQSVGGFQVVGEIPRRRHDQIAVRHDL